ncbi:MAG: Xaa-Pro peptidase family protein [Nitrospinota bacterium]|nr:Xaa-Pro peptidase family protein [Nitrospinota bacterium]
MANIFDTSFDYASRLTKIRRLMDERDLDCVLVHKWPNQYYVSGFYQHLPWYPLTTHPGEAPLIIFRDEGKEPVFVSAYLIFNAVKEGTWIDDVRAYDRGSALGVYDFVAEILKEKGVAGGNVGIEEDCCTHNTITKLKEALPKAQFKNAAVVFNTARVVKEPAEIELIKESVAIAEAAMQVAIDTAKPGVSEIEVQTAAEIEMKRLGAIREVETMCQAGARTANYRAFASNWNKIAENDLVMVDLGCIHKGYGSDITRTWAVGAATDEQKKIANDLYRIHEKLLAFIKPGLKYHEVSDLAREELASAGYQSDKMDFPFQKFSLHGVGLGPFHDPPDSHTKDVILEAGMVLSVQPSMRHEKYSIRFEDDVIITTDGIENMNKLPRELI